MGSVSVRALSRSRGSERVLATPEALDMQDTLLGSKS